MTDVPVGEEAVSLCYIDLYLAKELALQELIYAAQQEVQYGDKREELGRAGQKYESACRTLHDFKFEPTNRIHNIALTQAVSPLAQFGIELESDKVKKALKDVLQRYGFAGYVEQVARQAAEYIEKLEKKVLQLEERLVTSVEIPLPDNMDGSEIETRQKLRQILSSIPASNRSGFLLTLTSRPSLLRQTFAQ